MTSAISRFVAFRLGCRVACAALLALSLAACSSVRDAVGLDSNPPDEFKVMVRAPLSMPPDYDLKAPHPGAPRPQDESLRDRTKQIVLDAEGNAGAKKVKPDDIKGVTPAEAALLHKLGADQVDSNIRQVVNRETNTLEEENKTFVEDLLFWKKQKNPAKVVNPEAERRRLQENAALGRPATAGLAPEIERKKSKSLLDTIF